MRSDSKFLTFFISQIIMPEYGGHLEFDDFAMLGFFRTFDLLFRDALEIDPEKCSLLLWNWPYAPGWMNTHIFRLGWFFAKTLNPYYKTIPCCTCFSACFPDTKQCRSRLDRVNETCHSSRAGSKIKKVWSVLILLILHFHDVIMGIICIITYGVQDHKAIFKLPCPKMVNTLHNFNVFN